MKASALGTWIAVILAGVAVSQLQPKLASHVHAVKMKEDIYLVPPPEHLKWLTLGYDAAMVDHLWAKLLIEYGTHVVEKRSFPYVTNYLDAITTLEPDYAPAYRFADTFIAFRPPAGTADDARLAKKYLERGIKNRPYDREMWMHYGQFMAFLAPSFLTNQEEKDRFRREGADAISRAVELGGDVDRGLGAAGILSKAGEREAAIKHLERWYNLTDDPATRENILKRLRIYEEGDRAEKAEKRTRFIETQWRSHYFFVPRTAYLLMAPLVDPMTCVGPASADEPACARDWTQAFEAAHR